MEPTVQFVISLILNVAFWGGVVYAILRVLDRVLPERLGVTPPDDHSPESKVATRPTRGLQLARSPASFWADDPPARRRR